MEIRYQKNGLCAQFNCYMKKCLRNEARNMAKAQRYLADHEVLFCELPEFYVENLCADRYDTVLLHTFQALQYSVYVENDRLSEALRLLPEEKRSIVLLHYYLDFSDLEISRLTHIPQTQVKKTRQRTLNVLRKKMEDTSEKD